MNKKEQELKAKIQAFQEICRQLNQRIKVKEKVEVKNFKISMIGGSCQCELHVPTRTTGEYGNFEIEIEKGRVEGVTAVHQSPGVLLLKISLPEGLENLLKMGNAHVDKMKREAPHLYGQSSQHHRWSQWHALKNNQNAKHRSFVDSLKQRMSRHRKTF